MDHIGWPFNYTGYEVRTYKPRILNLNNGKDLLLFEELPTVKEGILENQKLRHN